MDITKGIKIKLKYSNNNEWYSDIVKEIAPKIDFYFLGWINFDNKQLGVVCHHFNDNYVFGTMVKTMLVEQDRIIFE